MPPQDAREKRLVGFLAKNVILVQFLPGSYALVKRELSSLLAIQVRSVAEYEFFNGRVIMLSYKFDVKLQANSQRQFINQLLHDINALEQMLNDGLLETELRRIGAEQELVIVDSAFRPAPIALDILNQTSDAHYTNEIGLFNLEFNLDPLVYEKDCLSKMEQQLSSLLAKIRSIANSFDADVVMAGILPTFRKSDLGLHNLTPKGRYRALNDAIMQMRGGVYELNIKGTDELHIDHDSVMLEAANSSFQIHFQVSPHEFATLYNIAQVATAPVLAAAVNSPLLFGKRLWEETRIVVFQQAIDTRTPSTFPRDLMPRVNFGTRWVRQSVIEIFQEDISRFRAIVGTVVDENSCECLRNGRIPYLKALQLFNGTIYRWNRPCYGITEGRPHLRIENRALPAGPTPVDEMANAAFWLGLIRGMAAIYPDITRVMHFDDAKINFFAAARLGLNAQFLWFNREIVPARKLILEQLLPLAREGLQESRIAAEDIDRYLGIIEARVTTGRSGAGWLLDSFRALRQQMSVEEALMGITASIVAHQRSGKPVHEWPLAAPPAKRIWKNTYQTVEQVMSTDLLTVGPEEPVSLAASLMIWKNIRHLPVEDNQNKLVGILTYRALVRLLLPNRFSAENQSMPVNQIMVRDPITVLPDTPILQATEIMRQKQIGCLPVVRNGRLVGLLTEQDLAKISVHLLEDQLQE